MAWLAAACRIAVSVLSHEKASVETGLAAVAVLALPVMTAQALASLLPLRRGRH